MIGVSDDQKLRVGVEGQRRRVALVARQDAVEAHRRRGHAHHVDLVGVVGRGHVSAVPGRLQQVLDGQKNSHGQFLNKG